MAVVTGKLIRVSYDDLNTRGELTLEVEHDDKSMTYLVVPVNRMTERIPPKRKARAEKESR